MGDRRTSAPREPARSDLIRSQVTLITSLADGVIASGGTLAEWRAGVTAIVGSAGTSLPVLRSGRRPKFFADVAVRDLMISLHREVEIAQARALCRDRFGEARTPSKSALHRFWMYLDELGGRRT